MLLGLEPLYTVSKIGLIAKFTARVGLLGKVQEETWSQQSGIEGIFAGPLIYSGVPKE
jgi:hypothetical protein